MITYDDLKKICNFNESNKAATYPSIMVSYMDYVIDDEEHKLEIKRKNRELTIDAIVDDKIEEYQEAKNNGWGENSGPFDSIASLNTLSSISNTTMELKVFQKSFTPSNFKDLDTLYNDIIYYLDTLSLNTNNTGSSTKKGFPPTGGQSLDLNITNDPNKTDSENFNMNSRRIISRIIMSSSYIAVTSRIGPATTAIVGSNILKYITTLIQDPLTQNTSTVIGQVGGINIIHSTLIDPKKAIVIRADQIGFGLNVIINNDNTYYMGEIHSDRAIRSFKIY